MADQEDFPDIYIDGSSGGDGSQASPYTNISDINWTTGGDNSIFDYLAGTPTQSPTIHLAKGGEWRERMIISASGTAAYPIIITSYGSGAAPIINGMDAITGWTAYSGTENNTFTTLDTDYAPGADAFATRTVIPASTLTNNGTQVRVQIRANSSTDTIVGGCSIGEQDSAEDYGESPTRLTFDTGNEGKTISAGTTAWTDWVNYTYTTANAHLVHVDVYHDTTRANVIRKGSYLSGTYYKANSDTEIDEEMDQAVDGYSSSSSFYNIQQIEIKYSVAGTYYVEDIGSTTDPGTLMVVEDATTRLTYNSDKDNLSAGEFYHDYSNDDLYIRLSGDADPSGHTIEAQIRRDCIRGGSDDYITVQNITLEGGFDGIWMYQDCNYWTIDNCTFTYNGGHNLKLEGASGHECTNNTIRNNTFGIVGGCGRAPGISPFSLRIDWADTNTIESNVITDGEYGGIYITDSDSNIFRYNWIAAEGSNTMTLVRADSNEIYYNVLILNNHDNDWILQFATTSLNNVAYNNVLYGAADRGVEFTGNSTGNTFKNNIIENTTVAVEVDSGSETSIAIDYNCYKNTTGTPFDWTGTDYNFTDWQSNSSQDAHSYNQDPVFADTSSEDFTLQVTSPCLNTGVDVSLTTDYAGNAVTDPPNIGAYETVYAIGGGGLHLYMGLEMS